MKREGRSIARWDCNDVSDLEYRISSDQHRVACRWRKHLRHLRRALVAEARKHGDPTIRRVYGKSEHIAAWDAEGFRLMQTRPGKNAADLLLSIDAMALALREGSTCFIIASSDGDFVYLATQLREFGAMVIGVGERKTPAAFRSACTKFIQLGPQTASTNEATKWPATKIIPQIRDILQYTNRLEGWGDLSWIGTHLHRREPDFDPRDYGHATLESLIEGVRYFETIRTETGLRLRDPNRKEASPPLHQGAASQAG